MHKSWIVNKSRLTITPEREMILDIAEAGLDAIETNFVVQQSIILEGNILNIKDKQFNLDNFNRILVLGFGKASRKAALAIDEILGDKITDGVVISLKAANCKHIRCYEGTHPLPSLQNVQIAEKMAELVKNVTEKDLVICLVSGGGSALLTWTKEECDQGVLLYNNYLKTGDDIKALNTVRKHISLAKGGGIAKILYPATVVGLIFSDIAGENEHLVDSGPTFYDGSTVKDAQGIIDKYDLGKFNLVETPKEKKYFEKVTNITLVSNCTALDAMKLACEKIGKKAVIVSAELLDPALETLNKIMDNAEPGTFMLGGSEIKLIVKKSGGRGGRNMYLATFALNHLKESDTLLSIDSDGLDNSDCAGAIVDSLTMQKVSEQKLYIVDYLDRYDGYSLFEQTGHELIYTGPTEANVSDYIIFFRK